MWQPNYLQQIQASDCGLTTISEVQQEQGNSTSAYGAQQEQGNSAGVDSEIKNNHPQEDPEIGMEDEEEFDDDMAQSSFDDFMVCLPYWMRKTSSVLLISCFQKCHGMNVSGNAVEADVSGHKKTTTFFNKGKFSDLKGKYKRFCLFNDEDIQCQCGCVEIKKDYFFNKGKNFDSKVRRVITLGSSSVYLQVHSS